MERPAECAPEREETFLERLTRDLNALAESPLEPSAEMHPIFNRISGIEAFNLLNDYHSGYLARHDDKLSWRGTGCGGFGSTLIKSVTAQQVEQVLLLMSLMKPRPAAHLPHELGWWVYCLDVAQGRVDPFHPDWRHLPLPTYQDSLNAFTVFAIYLFKEVFGHGQEGPQDQGTQAA